MEYLQDNVDSNVLEHHSAGRPHPSVPHSQSPPARRVQHASHDAAEQSHVQEGTAADSSGPSEMANGIQGTLSTRTFSPEAALQDTHAQAQLATNCGSCMTQVVNPDGSAQPERSVRCSQGHGLLQAAATAEPPSAAPLKHLPCDVQAWQSQAEGSPPEATEAADGSFQVSACLVPTQSTASKPPTTALLHEQCSSTAGEPTIQCEASEPAGGHVSACNGSDVTVDFGKAPSPALLYEACNSGATESGCEHQGSRRSAGLMTAEGGPEANRQQVKQTTRLTCAELDWENPAHLAALGTFDIILVADVVNVLQPSLSLAHPAIDRHRCTSFREGHEVLRALARLCEQSKQDAMLASFATAMP